jgi:hypothetical protein
MCATDLCEDFSMKSACIAVLASLTLSGCAWLGGSAGGCEVFSPAAVALPTTQNDQRVETNSTGDSTAGRNNQQNCESKG